MLDYLRALHAEGLKIRRTSALMLALVAPYTVVLLQALIVHQIAPRVGPEVDGWLWLGGNCLLMWTAVLLPLFVALEAALLADLEHRNRTFKHLFALPTRRVGIYGAKLTTTFVLTALSLVLMASGTWLAGKGLHRAHPTLGFDEPFPLALWLRAGGYVLLGCLMMVAIHVWLSLRRLGFAPTLGLAVLATLTTGVVARFDEGLWLYFPWALPVRLFEVFKTEVTPAPELVAFCILGGLGVAVLGGWDVLRRDVTA